MPTQTAVSPHMEPDFIKLSQQPDVLAGIPCFPPTIIQSPLRRFIGIMFIRMKEMFILAACLHNPVKIYRALKQVVQIRKLYFGQSHSKKFAYVNGRYYWGFHSPGLPSLAFTSYLTHTIKQLEPQNPAQNTLHMAFVAITKKCPLACEHCFEWDNLNKREKLSLSDLKKIVKSLQEKKIAQIHFSGGEPMLRVEDMIEVIKTAKPGTNFWVITSGYNFTSESANNLKKAGLTGVSISLDHYLPQQHNTFRKYKDAFENAIQAVAYAHQAGLIVSLSLCVTRSMATEENLMQYALMAKKLGVAFIQLLEPRAVGHYADKPVELAESHIHLLNAFYEKLNFNPAYYQWPIITFHGYHQRRAGCSGAGVRFLYIDTDGDVHACPFCQKKSGSTLQEPLEDCLNRLQERGCHIFENAKNLSIATKIKVS